MKPTKKLSKAVKKVTNPTKQVATSDHQRWFNILMKNVAESADNKAERLDLLLTCLQACEDAERDGDDGEWIWNEFPGAKTDRKYPSSEMFEGLRLWVLEGVVEVEVEVFPKRKGALTRLDQVIAADKAKFHHASDLCAGYSGSDDWFTVPGPKFADFHQFVKDMV